VDYKSQPTEFKADAKQGLLEGYASRFGNSDSYNDIVRPGAFAKTISERANRIKVLYQHNPYEPIGKPVEMREDTTGLYTVSRISKTPLGEDVLTLAGDGVLSEMSIGYDTIKEAINQETGTRELLELRLWEYSPVTFAANDLAVITGVKSPEELDPILERVKFLRERGLKEGRVLSQRNFSRLQTIVEELQALLADAEPSKDTPAKHNEPPAEPPEWALEVKNLRSLTAEARLRAELADFSRTLRSQS
jgi:HK97 family phage prohead protease